MRFLEDFTMRKQLIREISSMQEIQFRDTNFKMREKATSVEISAIKIYTLFYNIWLTVIPI